MKKPAWLRDLEEDESVLHSSERMIVEEVYYATEKEIERQGFGDEGEEVSEKIDIEQDLKVIVYRLMCNQEEKQRFIDEFPNWQNLRINNVEALENIGYSLHSTRKKGNISRLVGNCTSLVGGGICIASAVLTPFTLGVSAPLAVAGGTITFLGSATAVGTTVTEITKLRSKVQEVNSILRRDKESFDVLKVWLTHATEQPNALESVLEDDRLVGILRIINEFAEVIFSTKAYKTGMINHFVKSIVPKIPRELIRSTSNLVSLLLVISLLHKRNHTDFEIASKTLKVVADIVSLVDLSVDAFQTASTFIKGDIAITANVSKAVVKGGVALFGMTLDMASIALTSIDVHKGSLSEEGLRILEIAKKLRDEFSTLEKVYKELCAN